jgi:hypothetical protein
MQTGTTINRQLPIAYTPEDWVFLKIDNARRGFHTLELHGTTTQSAFAARTNTVFSALFEVYDENYYFLARENIVFLGGDYIAPIPQSYNHQIVIPVRENQTYYYRLNITGEPGPYNITSRFSERQEAPVWPRNIRVRSFSITWVPLINAERYLVYRSTNVNGPFTQIGTTQKAYYADSNVTGSTTYYYRVAAQNPAGIGPQTATVSLTTPQGNIIPQGVWVDGNLTRGEQRDQYLINAAEGQTYYIWVYDRESGFGAGKTAVTTVAAYEILNSGAESYHVGGSTRVRALAGPLVPMSSGFLHVAVLPRSNSAANIGSYAVTFTETNTMPPIPGGAANTDGSGETPQVEPPRATVPRPDQPNPMQRR